MDAHVHLIKETDCHKILYIPTTLQLAEQITINLRQSESSTYTISTTIAPEVADLLPAGKEAAENKSKSHYPYNKTWDKACNDPCVVVHTSGSTGMPKVIYYTQRMLANPVTQSLLPPVEGRLPLLREWHGCRILTTVPPFHVSQVIFKQRLADIHFLVDAYSSQI
jgi:long-subunit acyl-CoA synthetase (AMP-forming)